MAIALVATVSLVITRAGADQDSCPGFRESARDRAGLVTGDGREVLVIGDSYAAGLGVRLRESWPARLPGKVRVDAFSGSGFTRHASPCGNLSYAARAPHSVRETTELVVVEGGLNDVDQPAEEVIDGFASLMTTLDGRPVVVVGPAAAPARAEGAVRIDALLADLARSHGATYISMLGVDLPFSADGLHLTAEGHQLFGEHVADQLEQLPPHTERRASVGGTPAARAAG